MSALVPQRPIGADLAVSVFGFGSASIGNLYRVVPEEQARGCVEAAWDAGMRYFDTAPHYGVGLSERRLGAALADKPRADYVLSTKVGRLLVPNPHPTGSDLANAFDTPDTFTRVLDYSAAGVRRSLEESLGRLGVDRVDIVFVHDPDDFVEQTRTEALPELARMREEGIVGAIGVGMNQWQAPLHLLTQGEVALDVVMLAGRWTLLDRSGAPLVEAALAHGARIVAAAPFNSGLLARDEPSPQAHFDYGPAPAELLDAARRLAALAREYGTTLPAAAIQFPLRHPAVASVVGGLSRAAYVESSLAWLGAEIPEEFWAAADEVHAGLSPGLGLS